MNNSASVICPVCDNLVAPSGPSYTVDDLFEMWKPVVFSQQTIDQHKRQSGHTRMYACAKCKLEIFLPKIIGTPDFYTSLQGEAGDSYYDYVDVKWDFVVALGDANGEKKIIDIGCGPGVFLDLARGQVDQVVGIEYNQQALNIARGKGLNVFDVQHEPSKLKGQFDVAFSFHVLEHVADPVAFIREMFTWVKPGGKVAISVPNMDGPIKYINPCVSNMPPHHATRWRSQTFKALARKLGLSIERIKYEPLIARDHYYYSSYWVKNSPLIKKLPAQLQLVLQKTFPILFDRLFKLLAILSIKELSPLKGQSIYVVLSKKN